MTPAARVAVALARLGNLVHGRRGFRADVRVQVACASHGGHWYRDGRCGCGACLRSVVRS